MKRYVVGVADGVHGKVHLRTDYLDLAHFMSGYLLRTDRQPYIFDCKEYQFVAVA